MPPDRIPAIVDDVRELKADVHDIDTLLREARERLAGLSGQVRVIIALLLVNGMLNLAALIHPH